MKRIIFLFILIISFTNTIQNVQANELNQIITVDPETESIQVKLNGLFEDKEFAGLVLKELQK